MTSQSDNKHIKEFENVKDQMSKSLEDILRFIDEIPDAPARVEIPFPYGTSEPRPYGWFSDSSLSWDGRSPKTGPCPASGCKNP